MLQDGMPISAPVLGASAAKPAAHDLTADVGGMSEPSPGADVGRASPVPAQMWHGGGEPRRPSQILRLMSTGDNEGLPVDASALRAEQRSYETHR